MKNKILDALKTKFEGVSDQILGRMAEKLLKTTTKEEEIATAVEGVSFQSLLEQYGDSRATEAQKTAITNYETKHNIKDGKPVATPPTPPTPPAPPEDTPDWAKALIESNNALRKDLDNMKAEKVAGSRKSEISEIIKTLPESLRKAYERTPVDSLTDEQFAELKSSIKSEVENISKDMSGKGAVFTPPKAGGVADTKKASSDEADAVVNQMHI